jgi:hypothetical protein
MAIIYEVPAIKIKEAVMKTTFKQLSIICGVAAVLLLPSCDTPVSLGQRLDIDGPVITIEYPAPRKPVVETFTVQGTAVDYSGTDVLLVKVVVDNTELSRQWRYNKGKWEITDNAGKNWAAYSSENTSWKGSSQKAVWSLDINLPEGAADGEYTIMVQAWDKGGMTDDNSYKTRVVIVDRDPPKVNITDPFLYVDRGRIDKKPTDADFIALDGYADDDITAMHNAANIGRFITRAFNLQYQIDDNSDVWSIEIRLYDANTATIDQDPESPLPEGYIFNHVVNDLPLPPDPDPAHNIKPNGTIKVPALDDPSLVNRITGKTTVTVVASCFDAAGNANQEKILGYLIYWPAADKPWIAFSEGMNAPDEYPSEDKVYMVYPGRNIKATAYQAHGLEKVEYRIYRWIVPTETIANNTTIKWDEKSREDTSGPLMSEENTPNFSGAHSTIFPWEFSPPASTGYYSIVATAYGDGDVVGDEQEVMFFVQDVSFPDFPLAPSPLASRPLYESIGVEDEYGNATSANCIRIHGLVSDATGIKSLYLVWINPQSRNFAAMSQLQYFRKPDYEGWKIADSITVEGDFKPEDIYDKVNTNKVWKVPLNYIGKDNETGRELYEYSQEINLTEHLNIAGTGLFDSEPLKSQMFLLRAENNPDGKCTIITYAPQGDEDPPVIEITKVKISGVSQNQECEPGKYALIEQFEAGDVITIEGTWTEDSTGSLDFETYLKNNFEITINSTLIPAASGTTGTTLVFTPNSGKHTSGRWTATATLGSGVSSPNLFKTESMKDTLVVSAFLKDIGGNIAEHGGSWLIRNDTLKLLRISSERADTKYNTGTIEIFLEFNKPVRRPAGVTAAAALQLNVVNAAGTPVNATATYKPNQTAQNTRQYFVYTVADGHNTPADSFLDVERLAGASGTDYWTGPNYAFTWEAIQGANDDREEIRLTMENGHTDGTTGGTAPNVYYTRKLPLYGTADNVFSLRAGKNIEIDTRAPTVKEIKALFPPGYYGEDADISIEVTFSEAVKISGTPTLTLPLSNATRYTGTNVKVNDDKISFSYAVQSGDTTAGSQITVNGFSGTITDIAGNALDGGISGTLTGSYIETIPPGVPVVKIKTADGNTHGDTITNVVSNNVGGTTVNGFSTTAPRVLSTLYNDDLWLEIDGNIAGGAYKLESLEYSVNNGTSWVRAPSFTGNAFVLKLDMAGTYQIRARQIDRAGNISGESQPVTFTWDPGTLVTRITSTSSNGTYTHNTDRDKVNITVSFRKPLVFETAPTLTLNARTTTTGTTTFVTVPGTAATPIGSSTSSLTYTYTVQRTNDTTRHNIQGNLNLDVTGFNIGAFTAYDSADTTTRVNVSGSVTVPPTGRDARLGENKAIKIDTAALTVGEPTFNGSVQTDGTWAGTMSMTFSQPVSKWEGSIQFVQIQGDTPATRYRLPAVLTEAQYNKLRDVANINTFYSRGTNGYIIRTPSSESSSDTSTKYVLAYTYDTADPNPVPAVQTFADAMRLKEGITIPVNAQAVTISGSTLTVSLTGSNALQVPGATYAITIPARFVQDDLGNTNTLLTYERAVSGVAKPFVRIRKSQDVISVAATPDATTPRYTALQPQTTQARMDCRTPGAVIIYRYRSTVTSVTGRNWAYSDNEPNYPNNYQDSELAGKPRGPHDSLTGGNPVLTASDDPRTGTPVANPSEGTSVLYNTELTLPLGTVADYQGYQWLVRAVGRTGTSTYSDPSEEIAYRTVLTYQINNMGNTGTYGVRVNDGEQVWIRGGDAIGSSSVPGYPLTWADDWDSLKGKRAGIRLMTKSTDTAGNNLYNSTWKWVSWEINVPAYFDMIKGINAGNDATVTWQYGPTQWAYQRDGWTSYKDQYPMFPGKHRWLYVNAGTSFGPKGSVNFSATWSHRRTTYTNADGWTAPNTANPTPAP